MSESDVDTSRVVVQTYVPAYQRDEWDNHAAELEMSRSEFVRAMVQAGRRGFGGSPVDNREETTESSREQSADQLPDRITRLLENHGALSWDELLSALTDDIESRLEKALDDLQDAGQVRHSGRAGGYVLEDEG